MPPTLRTRESIYARLRTIKELRNRIAHHEPVWNMSPKIDTVHSTCCDLVGYISSQAAEALAGIDRLSGLYAVGFMKG